MRLSSSRSVAESTVAGIGASHQEQALAASTARALAAATGRPVNWQSVGANGATAGSTLSELVPQLQPTIHCAVVVLGVNDVLRFTTPARWRRNLRALIETLRRGREQPPWILLAGVPPMNQFPRIHWPLNRVLGLRARALHLSAADLVDDAAVGAYLPLQFDDAACLFAGDGFHPSDLGYRVWGQQLASRIAARCGDGGPGSRAGKKGP